MANADLKIRAATVADVDELIAFYTKILKQDDQLASYLKDTTAFISEGIRNPNTKTLTAYDEASDQIMGFGRIFIISENNIVYSFNNLNAHLGLRTGMTSHIMSRMLRMADRHMKMLVWYRFLDFLVLEYDDPGLQAGKQLIQALLERTSDDLPAGSPCFAIAFKDERESQIYAAMHSEKLVAATSTGTIDSEIELWKVGT